MTFTQDSVTVEAGVGESCPKTGEEAPWITQFRARTAALPHSCHCDDSILYPLWSAVKILTQQGLVSFLFRRYQEEASRGNLPVIPKPTGEASRWEDGWSVKQEGCGGPGCAGRRPGGHDPPATPMWVLHHQDPILAQGPQPFIRPCSERASSCAERRVPGGRIPFRRLTSLSPSRWLEASMSTACLGGRKSHRAPFPSKILATELHFLAKSAIKDSGKKENSLKLQDSALRPCFSMTLPRWLRPVEHLLLQIPEGRTQSRTSVQEAWPWEETSVGVIHGFV